MCYLSYVNITIFIHIGEAAKEYGKYDSVLMNCVVCGLKFGVKYIVFGRIVSL